MYAKARENFDRLLREGVLARDPEPYYYLYRLVMGTHTQVGLVAVASVAATRPAASAATSSRVRTRKTTACARSTRSTPRPVRCFLTYRHAPKIDAMAEIVTRGKPSTWT